MEVELEPRVKALPYKIRGMSRESPTQKAVHVLDPDLRTHWSTATNTKEWILLELEETCLLSHIRIHNKSVLEWEIAVGLRFKPDMFLKVRPRCEAPRRDMVYPINYMPCRFVRISCLRGNPIAIFFVQLIGVPVPGLEQEFQPVVDYLLPHIVLHKQDTHDIYLQLLQDVTCRLSPFLPQLESELSNFAEAVESNIRFLAMLAAPFYPILCIVGERESAKVTGGMLDMDPVRSNQGILTISSNFQAQPRRLRAPVPNTQQSASSLVFRPDAVLLLLRKAYKDNHLGNVCRSVARLLRKLTAPGCSSEVSQPLTESVPLSGSEDVTAKVELAGQTPITDYSHLFGEEFKIFEEDMYDVNISNVLDVAAVEEGLLHMLYACSSQPIICRRLGDSKTDLLPALPLIQAMLPALRPAVGSASNSDQVDETFWQWQNPLVQHSLTQIAAVSSSSSYQPLLDACAGYLSSYSPAHARAACVLLDLCSGPLAPWLPMVIAKVDLTIELLEDLLGVIQNAQHAIAHARAALIYIMLALSGHMDDLLPKFKDAKHSILFLIEMLEPFLVPAITTIKNTIAFGDVSTVFLEKQEKICAIALDLLCTAVQRPAVLPALENEWRRGVVEPSVLLSILAPHVPLPPGINLCKSSMTKGAEHEASTFSPVSSAHPSTTIGKISSIEEDVDGKSDMVDGNSRNDATEDGSLLFAPAELKNISLRKFSTPFEGNFSETQGFGQANLNVDGKLFKEKDNISKKKLTLDIGCANEYFDLQREYLQLVNHQDRELRASEFRRFAEELHAQSEINLESHDAAIDALLLAAECHLNPYFMMGSSENEQLTNIIFANKDSTSLHVNEIIVDEPSVGVGKSGAKIIAQLEGMRDKTVIDILLQAAQWDSRIHNATLNERSFEDKSIDYDFEERPYGIKIFPDDVQSADAVTLVRQHQSLLCGFLVRQLQREQHNMYEVLLHGLLFFLYSATHVSCHSENVVDVILQSAERLNRLLFSLHQEQKETSPPVEPAKIHRVRRQWALLQRIVFVASGNGIMEDGYMHIRRGCWYRDLIPVSSWMDRISKFSSSPLPLVRYIGWMGLARYATEHKKRGLLLTQDMRQLTGLLSIFSDELISVKSSFKGKENEGLQDACFLEFNVGRLEKPVTINSPLDSLDSDGVVHAFYPEMDVVFPELRKHFFTYAEIMLEAVCLQVKAMPPCSIPDILSWFSELCSNPFLDLDRDQYAHVDASDDILKGVVVSNVKCILLHILEVIVLEHMEAIIPEIPRVIQVLLSLCSSSYCDVPLLDSVLSALKPLISYTVATASASEKFVEDDPSSMNFESLCFDALINQLESGPEQKKGTMVNTSQGALLIFLAGSLLSDLSISRRRQLMQSLLQWAKFTGFQATTTYYNYLCAFRKVLEGCNSLVQETLRDLGASLMNEHPCSKKDSIDFICKELSVLELCDRGRKTLDLYGVQQQEERSMVADSFQVKDQTNTGDGDIIEHGTKRAGSNALQHFSCISDVEDFTKSLEALIFMLSPTIEICWKFHSQMTRKLSQTGAACLLYSGFLLSNYQSIHSNKSIEKNESSQFVSESEQNLFVWQNSLQGLGQAVLTLQQNHCWQVAAVLLEYLLSLPSSFSLDGVLGPICSALLFVCCHAPKVTWRLQTGKWLSKLFQRDCLDFSSSTSSLVDLFCTMLEHSEPEQRYIALQHLGRIVEHEELGKLTSSSISGSSSTHMNMVMTVKRVSQRGVVSALVANTWDRIASLAACEPSMTLRKEAMELLERFIPFSERYQLRSFFSSVDTILPGLCMPSYSMQDGPLTVLGLSVLARACLYSEADDIDIISPSVWDNLELLAKSKNEIIPVAAFIHAEKAVCHALLQLKEHGEEAKEILKAALGRSSEDTQVNPDLADVRESVLQVLARLNSIRSKSDGFTEFAEKEAKELEEAEIELELMQEEKTLQEGLKNSSQIHQTIRSSSRPPMKSTHQRLQELRTQIRDMEHSEIRAEIAARRERERIARRTRQMTLEETALREIELLQDLDRERIAEVEREVERQKVLEKERAKTRELRHSLDLETERRTQREIQRELEQRESGLRSSRREFSTSTPGSRPRERYREREGGRPSQEGSLRPGSSGSGVRENGTTPPATPTASVSNASVTSIGAISSTPTIVTNSSRVYPVQISAFSHARDRGDERGYDDSFDGIRESGDACSIGDPETASTMDMMASGGFGVPHRQGSRGTKPRPVVERRERDGRREGKWERKQC